jgi:hypothetical protein
MTTSDRMKLTEPLESVTTFFGLLTLFAIVASAGFALFGNGFIGSLGTGSVCVSQSGASYGDSSWRIPPGVSAQPGGSASITGTVEACAIHPSIAERVLYGLTVFPMIVLWGGVLLLLWRMIRVARRAGPFTPRVASAMRRLGWFILLGSFTAAAMRTAASDQLLTMTIRAPQLFADLIWEPIRGLVPVPALTGAALLTFARIIRLGAEMDDEIKGTV